MFTSQISKALNNDLYAGKDFIGVYPIDRLPKRIDHPASMVVNTDPAHKPGKHWLALYFDKKGHLDYFDSYGMPPVTYQAVAKFIARNSQTFSFNERQLQGFNTNVCGQYCIAFIALRARGYSLTQILDYYSSNGRDRPGAQDDIVRQQVNNFFNINTASSKKNTHIKKCRGQCCTARNCA